MYNEYLCLSKSGMLYKKEWYSGNTTFLWNNTQGGLIKNWEGQGQNYTVVWAHVIALITK